MSEAISDPGPLPRLEWLPITALYVDETYQRKITGSGQAAIRRIARDFRWRTFMPPVVAPIDGERFAVLDGQHRLLGVRERGGIDKLPCYIVDAPEVAEQARSFIAINNDRIRITYLDQFWARVAAGELTPLRIKAICDKAGVTILRAPARPLPALSTVAIRGIEKVLQFGDATVREGLQLMAQAYPETEDVFRAAPIVAVVRMLAEYGAKVDRERFVATLEDTDFEEKAREAAAARKVISCTLEEALIKMLVRAYNKRPGRGRLPDTLPARPAEGEPAHA